MLSGVRSEAEERNEASAFFTFPSTGYRIYVQVLITIEVRTNFTDWYAGGLSEVETHLRYIK